MVAGQDHDMLTQGLEAVNRRHRIRLHRIENPEGAQGPPIRRSQDRCAPLRRQRSRLPLQVSRVHAGFRQEGRGTDEHGHFAYCRPHALPRNCKEIRGRLGADPTPGGAIHHSPTQRVL